MNCRKFERLSRDLVRNRWMNKGEYRRALDHAESCARCGKRLDEERTLSARLQSLAVSMEKERAPEKLETALVEAYRRRMPASTPWLSATLESSVRLVRRNSRRVMIVAAALLLSAISFQLLLTRPSSILPTHPEQELIWSIEPVEQGDTADERLELTTDFFPLVQCVGLDCFDDGQLVRITMPRPTLILFGLPMNEQLVQESVTADVFVGGDGVARAIRFVR